MQRDSHFSRQKATFLSTAGAAGKLGLTTEGVRGLVREGQLACTWMETGPDTAQRVFLRGEVERCLLQRREEQTRSRRARLVALRLRMLKADHAPGQPRLRLVGSPAQSERSLEPPQVKAARSFDERRGSDTSSYVNRKIAGGRR
jgi:hypothetical protein